MKGMFGSSAREQKAEGRVGTLNVVTNMVIDVAHMMARWKEDILCVQEVKLKRSKASRWIQDSLTIV